MTSSAARPSSEWSVRRLVVAGSAIVVGGLLAVVLWTVGQAQYLDDYCTGRVSRPTPSAPEALSGRPGYLSGPMTVRCEYDALPTVEVTDPVPLLGALALGAVVVGAALPTFRWARRPATP